MNRPGIQAASSPFESDAAGFVLAGGRSSRMGEDKSLVDLNGQPLIVHALGILREARLHAFIAGGRPELAAHAPMVEDVHSGLGPLSGVCAAVASTSADWAVFLPVDMPLLPASLIAYLLRHARISGQPVTVTSVNGFAQTFPAVVHRSVLPALERELEAGRRGCFAAFQAAADPLRPIPAESLVQCGHVAHPHALPAARWFLNVNTPENLQCARVLHRAHIA